MSLSIKITFLFQHVFYFDEVFGEACTNRDVYMKTTHPLIQHIFNGYDSNYLLLLLHTVFHNKFLYKYHLCFSVFELDMNFCFNLMNLDSSKEYIVSIGLTKHSEIFSKDISCQQYNFIKVLRIKRFKWLQFELLIIGMIYSACSSVTFFIEVG